VPQILITGCTGQVGGELARLFPEALTPARAELDLASEPSIRKFLRENKPRWIINPAAYTAVDKAESEASLAFAINAEAPRILAEEALKIGASIIHYSTDYVFDGAKSEPYLESDPTNPLGVYGASKLAGEEALLASGVPHVTLRTSWVYGATGSNFLLTILRLAAQRPELKIVADQHGAPTWSRDLALLAQHIVANDPDLTRLGGIYHATSAGETTWHGFASAIVANSGLTTPVLPIPSSDFPTPAQRPKNSRLNCDKLAAAFSYRLPDWQTSLAKVLTEVQAQS
jgi:dTDP-4-dehydrorhamnose reductase